ncbi:MAG: acyl-CoA/acyl-ACP dehydrogenase [Actinobacteria bacterium]|nr:acyl-CoA/acyl-ACP dehydrogenase [Actinomycetota bacterium]
MAETPVTYAESDELELIRSTARQFLTDRLSLEVVRELMMSEDGFERGLWKEIANLGWAGLIISEEHGGAGYGFTELSVVLEEMGRLVTPGPFFASSVLATTAIQEFATEEEKADLLPGMASGETIATLALFETPRGWDLADLDCVATRDGAGWSIDGMKRHVLDGHLADKIVVAAAMDGGVGLFVVDSDATGVTVDQSEVLDPTRRQAEVGLDSVRVEDAALLGGGAVDGRLATVLALGTVALAAEQVGGAQRCLEMSVEHARTRYQFGRAIGSYQAIKHRCAEMLLKVEHAKSAAYHAARTTGDDDELAVAAPLAGSMCSEAYLWAAGETIQIHGGIGFTWEHDAHLYLKRAKSSALLLGDPRYQRSLLGDALGL